MGDGGFVDSLHKEVKVQSSRAKGRHTDQFSIQIPKEIVRELDLKKGDIVIIDVPLKDKAKYSIKFKKRIK